MNYKICNLQSGRSKSYKSAVLIKLAIQMAKRFPNFTLAICHFNFCHNRRNGSMVQRNVLPICHFDCKFNYFLSNITFLNLQHWIIYVQSFLDFCICNMYGLSGFQAGGTKLEIFLPWDLDGKAQGSFFAYSIGHTTVERGSTVQ